MDHANRNSFRCPIPQELQTARLHLEKSAFDLRLIDESSGGYQAESGPMPPEIRAGTKAVLRTVSGWYDVEVKRREDIGKRVRLGIVKHGDYVAKPGDNFAAHATTAVGRLLGVFRKAVGGDGMLVKGLVAVGLIAAIIAVGVVFSRRNSGTQLSLTGIAANPAADAVEFSSEDSIPIRRFNGQPVDVLGCLGKLLDARSKPGGPSARDLAQFATTLLAPLDSMMDRRAADRLSLSDLQQVRMHDVRARSEKRLKTFAADPTLSPKDIAQKIDLALTQAELDIRSIFTPGQVTLFEADRTAHSAN